jgi:hypothetical protein
VLWTRYAPWLKGAFVILPVIDDGKIYGVVSLRYFKRMELEGCQTARLK